MTQRTHQPCQQPPPDKATKAQLARGPIAREARKGVAWYL